MLPRDVMARWNKLRSEVEALAMKCEADPAEAAILGVEPEVAPIQTKIFNRESATAPVNVRAGWLRGAAKSIVTEDWRWEVQEMIGGNAALILLAYEPREPEMRSREYPP